VALFGQNLVTVVKNECGQPPGGVHTGLASQTRPVSLVWNNVLRQTVLTAVFVRFQVLYALRMLRCTRPLIHPERGPHQGHVGTLGC
jgi:hypothetical protein